ncbi:MAG: hypothetical protein WBJ21_05250, partial [Burkholderiaceae bacterium]
MTTADEAYDRLHGLDGCAQTPAQALRDAARFFEVEMSRAWGGAATWFTTGERVADLVAICLREHASDLDADRVAGVLVCGQHVPLARDGDCNCDYWHSKHRSHCATNYPEGVGTGADEGAAGQDTGTAWVTRSADCPEAPAQARPLGPDGFTPLAPESVENARRAEQAERQAEDAE